MAESTELSEQICILCQNRASNGTKYRTVGTLLCFAPVSRGNGSGCCGWYVCDSFPDRAFAGMTWVERALSAQVGWGEKAALGAPCRIRTVRAPGKRAGGAFSARTARVERARTSHSRGSWGRAAERVAGADRSERPENAPVARFQRGQRALSAQVGWGKKKESCTWCAL